MINSHLIKLIQQSVKQFKLDLADLNVLVPACSDEPCVFPLIASIAGAKNIYVKSMDINSINKIAEYQSENHVENITFFEHETPQIVAGIDVVVKGGCISTIDSKYISQLKNDAVISIYPDNFDFYNIKDINIEECTHKKIPVVTVNPFDSTLMLYKYISQVIFKRFKSLNLDLFRSKVMLVGSGELFDNTLSLLKSCGSFVYAVNLKNIPDKDYALKHISDSDAILVVDYPNKDENIIGSDGFITIGDIVDINPEVKIIHLAGKLQLNSLSLGRITCVPENIHNNTLSIEPGDIGIRGVIDASVATLKVAETLIKVKNRSVLSADSVITYNIVNADGPVVLGKIMF